MAFGRLVNKFRFLSGKIGGSMDRVSAILTACARLHNFIIREDRPFDSVVCYALPEEEFEALGIASNRDAPLGMSYLPFVPESEFEAFAGISCTWDVVVEFIHESDIRRQLHNIVHQR